MALLSLALGLISPGCAAHTNLEPTGRGKARGNVSVGGPLVSAFDTYIPMPYLSAGGSYGVEDDLDLNGTLHLLSLAYGLAGLDLGATWYPLLNNGGTPTLGLGARVMTFASFKSGVDDRFRAYPMLTSSAAWRLGDGMIYTGFDLTVPFTTPDYDTASAPVILSPLVGYRWTLGATTRLYTELKWHGVNVRTDQLATEYIHPGGVGAIAPLVALEIEF